MLDIRLCNISPKVDAAGWTDATTKTASELKLQNWTSDHAQLAISRILPLTPRKHEPTLLDQSSVVYRGISGTDHIAIQLIT